MGSFYTNVTVLTQDQNSVLEALRQLNRTAYVTPVDGRSVVVYDEACEMQDQEELSELCIALSERLQTGVLGVTNHDDDLLLLLTAIGGKVVDEYNSCPAYFDEAESESPVGGDASELARVLGIDVDVVAFEKILRDVEEYVFASERHQAVVDALGLSSAAVHTGYTYIEQDEGPEQFEIKELAKLG